MIIDRSREKLLNAIIFFSGKSYYSKTKLLKLLFLLDFEHFAQTGRSVTGVEYFAWHLGPVAVAVLDEFEEPSQDFSDSIEVRSEQIGHFSSQLALPKKPFNAAIFSKRELDLLDEIRRKYGSKTATELVEITHSKNGPWDRVYDNKRGQYKPIPYELAVDDNTPNGASVLNAKRERDEFLSLLSA